MTTLYRQFSAAGELLYVGIADKPFTRLAQHESSSAWAPEIASVTVQSFPSRKQAMEAERIAVLVEFPKYNKSLRVLPITKHSIQVRKNSPLSLRVPLNVRISQPKADQVRSDAADFETTNDIVTEVALEYFFTSVPKSKREAFYKSHRPYARK